jgi:hypothetical protein
MNTLRNTLGTRRLALGTVTVTTALATVGLTLALSTFAPSALEARADPNPLAPDSSVAKVRMEPLLAVTNDNWMDMHIYAVRDGFPISLGVVNGPGEQVFDLPMSVTLAGAHVQILALPIGGTEDFLSEPIMVNPGDVVQLDVANVLPISSISVRPASRVKPEK